MVKGNTTQGANVTYVSHSKKGSETLSLKILKISSPILRYYVQSSKIISEKAGDNISKALRYYIEALKCYLGIDVFYPRMDTLYFRSEL